MAIQQIMRGMTRETLPNGTLFVRLHYSADPEKGVDWAQLKKAAEADQRNWDVQMEMRDVVLDGYPVFERYIDSVHCPEYGHHRLFELITSTDGKGETVYDSMYLGGFDAGQTLNPAFLLIEFVPKLRKVRGLLEVISITGESMEEFAPRVRKSIDEAYPGLFQHIRFRGDATITTRAGTDKSTAQQVARKYGFDILPRTNDWTKRQAAVAFLIADGLPDSPTLEINGKGCPTLRRGFQGMYKFKVSTGPGKEQSGPGAVLVTPLKNAYSHVQDAMQYPSMDIYDMLKPGGGSWMDDDALLKRLTNRT